MRYQKPHSELSNILNSLYNDLNKALPPGSPVLKPINQKAEEDKFIQAFRKDKPYNPIFKYARKNIKIKQELHQKTLIKYDQVLRKYRYKVSNNNSLWQYLQNGIMHFNSDISGFQALGTNLYKDYIYSVYPPVTSKENRKVTKKYLFEVDPQPAPPATVKPKQAKKLFLEVIHHQLKQKKFKVELSRKSDANSFSGRKKRVHITLNRTFNSYSILRTLIHETTHLLRFLNGQKQLKGLLQFALNRQYLQTEEGLAAYFTKKYFPRTPKIYQAYFKNNTEFPYTSIIYLAQKYDFYTTFTKFLQLRSLKEQNEKSLRHVFKIITRHKRGIKDTSIPYGYTKDAIYYRGYKEVKSFFRKNKDSKTAQKLIFSGKLSLEDTQAIPKSIEIKKIRYDQESLEKIADLGYRFLDSEVTS